MTGWWGSNLDVLDGGPAWAFSVRPDLWGPGWTVTTMDPEDALAEWHFRALSLCELCERAEAQGLGAPGVAESLTLANKLDLESPDPGVTWTPGPKPAPGRPTW